MATVRCRWRTSIRTRPPISAFSSRFRRPSQTVTRPHHWGVGHQGIGVGGRMSLGTIRKITSSWSPTTLCPTPANPAAHCSIDPYATFISATPPYAVLGTITFKGAGGLEQPLWDPALGKFWITVPGPTGGHPSIARVDPISMMADKTYVLDCLALTGTASAGITGIALAPYQHLLVSACGFPITLNALTGKVYQVVKGVGGGDEVWHDPGDGRFYVTGPLDGI